MLTVTINDRPFDVAAIVERGRVMLPMRATFSALGASVSYDAAGRIAIARNAVHTLRLPIGKLNALIDGRGVKLDVPARVVAARIYVPLRFVAQAMGAVVAYDSRANIVAIDAAASALPQTGRADVLAINPLDSGYVSTPYPTISASLGSATAQRAGVVLRLDGEDVTSLASFDGATVTYIPRMPLAEGTHTVLFSGRTLSGQTFSKTWSFQTTQDALPERDVPSFQSFDYRFYANGPTWFHPGEWMHFTLIAPPGGSAALQLCGLGFQYPLRSGGYGNVYRADIPAPYGYWIPSCEVTAVYTTWSGQQVVVPVPLLVGLYTLPSAPGKKHPTPAPSHTPAPRPVPPEPRRPEPTPQPAPTTAPQAASTPRPVRTAHPIVRPPNLPRPRETPV